MVITECAVTVIYRQLTDVRGSVRRVTKRRRGKVDARGVKAVRDHILLEKLSLRPYRYMLTKIFGKAT